jgi:hypothetical protein
MEALGGRWLAVTVAVLTVLPGASAASSAIEKRVYAVGGGPSPGLFGSGPNELLTLP